MAQRMICVLGVVVFIAIAWAISSDRRRFPWRVVIGGLFLQFSLALLVLGTRPGQAVLRFAGDTFAEVMKCVDAGSGFLFSGPDQALGESLITTFVFGALPTIVFFSSLMSILYHLGVMQKVVGALAWVMRRTLGTSGTETLAAAANVFVGHTEAPLMIRPYLATMTRSELMAMMTGGFATVTGGLLGVYAGMGIDIAHLMTASIISAPAALVIAKVMMPETETVVDSPKIGGVSSSESNLIGAAVDGASEGMRLAINVAAMLIAFLALIALADLILATLCGWVGWVDAGGNARLSLGVILGYAFWPLAWLMGIPASECSEAGELIGIKTVANEFIAYGRLGISETLSPRSVTVLTYALAGFSNFGAVGILVGGLGTLEPSRKNDLSRFGIRAMFGGLLACCMTGAVVGILIR